MNLLPCIQNWIQSITFFYQAEDGSPEMTILIGKLAIQVMKCIELLIAYQGEEKYTETLITS